MAVFGSRPVPSVSSVALIAHVVSAKAVEDSNGAAEHALPVYLRLPVLFTDILAGSNLFQDAILAPKVLRLRLCFLSIVHFLFAVDKATKVWLFTLVAFIK